MTVDRRIIDLYDEYVHSSLPRREFPTRLARIAGGTAASLTALPLIEPNYAQVRRRRSSRGAAQWNSSIRIYKKPE